MATYEITVMLTGTATVTVEADTEAEAWDDVLTRRWKYGPDGNDLTPQVEHSERID